MGFRLPTFNLTCNISQTPTPPAPAIPPTPYRVAGQVCQLTFGKRSQVSSTGGTPSAGTPIQTMNLLLPPGVDIRGPQDSVTFDMVEVPAGTGRWYQVIFVDDIGKGFANEHRTAGLFALAFSWVAPYL